MGGGGDSNGVGIEYYKVIKHNDMFNITIQLSAILINAKQVGSAATRYIGAGSVLTFFGESNYNISGFAFIDKKSLSISDNGDILNIQGSLQERADYIATINSVDKININDYIEPITEEEFYNIKPE